MKITRDMFHADLRSYYDKFDFLAFLYKRAWGVKLINTLFNMFTKGKNVNGLHCEEHFIPSRDGEFSIRVRVYKPEDCTDTLPVMLYIHGGGYLFGNPEMSAGVIKQFIDTRPCAVISPDYRKALTKPFPAGFNDCYDTLLWCIANASKLGVDADQIIVAGHSAGGGLAAAVTLKARDTQDANIVFQMPIYPMIDDRQGNHATGDMDVPVWDSKTNRFAWDLYLKDLKENNEDIPCYAAAARTNDYRNIPPTITFVGGLEPFRDETIAYVDALKQQGVDVAFKLYEGCFHGFDAIASNTNIAQDATDFTYQSYAEYYDRYVA